MKIAAIIVCGLSLPSAVSAQDVYSSPCYRIAQLDVRNNLYVQQLVALREISTDRHPDVMATKESIARAKADRAVAAAQAASQGAVCPQGVGLLGEGRDARVQPSKPSASSATAHVGDQSVVVYFKTSPPPVLGETLHDDGVSSGFFAPLATRAASGDDLAATYLWKQVSNCRDWASTEAELHAQIDKIMKGNLSPEGNTLWGALANAKQHYQRCEGITEAIYMEALGLLRDAANHSTEFWPRFEYAFALQLKKDKTGEARQRFEALWDEGHQAALGSLASESPESPAYGIAAYSLLLAYVDDGNHAEGLVSSLRQNLDRLRRETPLSAYNEAAKQAAELLRNPYCCILP
jgi:hypothetical protein